MPGILPSGYDIPPPPRRAAPNNSPSENGTLRAHSGAVSPGIDHYSGNSSNPVGGPIVVTGDPRAEAGRRADRLGEQTGVELTVEEVLDSPHVFIGSVKDLTRKFVDLRERFGISSFLVDDLDVLAPAVEELAGR
jgi:hypothetical protein